MPTTQMNNLAAQASFKDSILQLPLSPLPPPPQPPPKPPKPYPRPAKRSTIKCKQTTTHQTSVDAANFESKTIFKRERKKSCTEILCELTRLKSQQKYLECNQVKFKLENFQDFDAASSSPSSATDASSFLALCTFTPSSPTATSSTQSATPTPTPSPATITQISSTSANTNSKSTPSTAQLINEIEQLKIDLSSKLYDFRNLAMYEVRDLRVLVDSIRDDVMQEERLRLFTLPAMRERIIGINKHLEYLRAKNTYQIEKLQKDFLTLERDVKLRLK